MIKRNKGKAHAFLVGEVSGGFLEHGRLLQTHTHKHTYACMHAYKMILSIWMDILPKALKVNTYAETIGLGNIFNRKKGPNFPCKTKP